MLSVLVRRGIDLSLRDKYAETALHAAAREHAVETVAALVGRFAMQVNAQNVWGETPLHVALGWDGMDKSVTSPPPVFKSAYPHAAARNASQIDVVNVLLAAGADVRAKDKTLWYIHRAAHSRGVYIYICMYIYIYAYI